MKAASSASILRSFVRSFRRLLKRARSAMAMKRGGFDAEGNQDDGSTMMDAVTMATTALETGKTSARSLISVSPALFRIGRCE